MSHYDYEQSILISRSGPPFKALIMAAIRKADTDNLNLIRDAWPEILDEFTKRYHAPGGLLPGDPIPRPDCYQCKHRREIPGDAHSRCAHPANEPLAGLRLLHVQGHAHGVEHGWFNWPMNYDPTWLLACDGFEEKQK